MNKICPKYLFPKLLILTVILVFASCDRNKDFQSLIVEEINQNCQKQDSCQVDLSTVKPFEWDKLYVFRPGIFDIEIEKLIDKKVEFDNEFSYKYIFIRAESVIHTEEHVFDFNTIPNGTVMFLPNSSDNTHVLIGKDSKLEVSVERREHGTYYSLICSDCNNLEPTNIDDNSDDPTLHPGNSFEKKDGSSIQGQIKRNEEISVSIPEIELKDEFDITVSVKNNTEISFDESDFAILFTVNYIIAPNSSFEGDFEKLVVENSESRLFGEKDFFLKHVPSLSPNIESKVYIGKIRIKRILDKFYPSNEAIADGNNNLRVWAIVLSATVLDRSGQPVSKEKKILRLNDARVKKG